jgi:PD-(D/E)XK nuclease superfamily
MQTVESDLDRVLVLQEPHESTPKVSSPFLQGTQIQYAWDSTSLGLLKRCPRLYQYTMIDGWSERNQSVHLRFGIEYHQALQDYDISRAKGISHDDAVHDTVAALLRRTADFHPENINPKHKRKTRESLTRSVIWYFEHFENDVAETIILDSGVPAVEHSFRFELDWGPQAAAIDEHSNSQPYLLSGHLDRIVRYHDEIFVMDRKTTTSTPGDYYFRQYEPDNQMTLYTLASQVILDSPVRGVIIDVAQIAEGFTRFVRGLTYRSPDQLDEWIHDLEYWLGLSEHYANHNHWPMNDSSCTMFGGCKFREVCSKSPQVREQFLKSNFDKLAPEDRWNPLKPR